MVALSAGRPYRYSVEVVYRVSGLSLPGNGTSGELNRRRNDWMGQRALREQQPAAPQAPRLAAQLVRPQAAPPVQQPAAPQVATPLAAAALLSSATSFPSALLGKGLATPLVRLAHRTTMTL